MSSAHWTAMLSRRLAARNIGLPDFLGTFVPPPHHVVHLNSLHNSSPKLRVHDAGGFSSGPQRQRQRSGRPRTAVKGRGASGAEGASYPFDEEDYHRASLQIVQGSESIMSGFLFFMLEDEAAGSTLELLLEEGKRKVMVVAIGGDSCQALFLLVQGLDSPRPLTLNLLWRVLERGQAISKQAWAVLRVAIVGTADNAFIGRLWFGNRDTGQVAWDVDCRPSDATWLALKAKAPIYIHRSVWEEHATPLALVNEQEQGKWQGQGQRGWQDLQAHLSRQAESSRGGGGGGGNAPLDPAAVMTTLRGSDPEPLKRLKMELRVALAEEDYVAAARIRDHPFMRLHLEAATARQEGDAKAAEELELQLALEVARAEAESQEQPRAES